MPSGKIDKDTVASLLLDCESLNIKYFSNSSYDSSTELADALSTINNETKASHAGIQTISDFLWKVYNYGSGVKANCSAPGVSSSTSFLGRLIKALDFDNLDTAMKDYGSYTPCACDGQIICDCQGLKESCPADGCYSWGGECDGDCTCYGTLSVCKEEGIHNYYCETAYMAYPCITNIPPDVYTCAWFYCEHFYWTTFPAGLSVSCEYSFAGCDEYGYECWTYGCTSDSPCNCDGMNGGC